MPEERTADELHRTAAFRRLTLLLVVAAILTIALYVLLYWQTGTWQLLVEAGFLGLAIVCAMVATRMVQRGRFDMAGYLSLFGLVVAFCGNELVWDGATLYITVSGILMALLAGRILLPHRRSAGIVAALLSGAMIALLNWFQPLPRYDIAQSPVLRVFIPGLTISLVLVTLWQIVYALRIGTIRTRLLISFIALAVLPSGITIVTSSILVSQDIQERVIAQLESVAALKEGEITTWLGDLQNDLRATLVESEVAANAGMLLQAPHDIIIRASVRKQLRDEILQMGRFETMSIVNLEGQVVVSSDPVQDGDTYGDEAFFREGLEEPSVQLSEKDFLSPGQVSVIAVRPIPGLRGQTIGVLVGCVGLEKLNAMLGKQAGLGETGETYLVGPDQILLSESRFKGYVAGVTRVDTEGANTALQDLTNGAGVYEGYRGVPVIGVYHWLPDLQVALLAEQVQSEALSASIATLSLYTVVTVISVLVAILAGLAITRSITTPLVSLAETVTQIADGKLELAAEVERENEIGKLAHAFNSMTVRLRELIGGLEQRVAERTQELEQRSAYMEASAEVSRAMSSILNVDQLVQQVVELIRERFGLYYVGLFLTDEASEWAVLRAGTGEAGEAMLARGHRLKIGLEGMIGWCIANAKARVALYAEEDVVRKVAAELPETRSEAALPLRSRGRVLGALTIQHDQFNAFDEDTIAVLQTMADQVAVALDNANLFTASQAALDATRRIYSELRREAWSELLRTQLDLGYRSHAGGVTPTGDAWGSNTERALQEGKTIQGNGTDAEGILPLTVPIKVRGDVIGVLDTHKSVQDGKWTPDEISLLETLAEQLGEALESARLYQDTQRRAAREQLTREITDKMRRATSVEGIVQVAVDELFDVIKTSRTFVRLETAPSEQDTRKRK